MNLRIHIDRLVLDGLPFSRSEGPLVQAEVEAELSRLFTEGGLAPTLLSGGAVPSVSADTIVSKPGELPAAFGQRIARSVYAGIGK